MSAQNDGLDDNKLILKLALVIAILLASLAGTDSSTLASLVF